MLAWGLVINRKAHFVVVFLEQQVGVRQGCNDDISVVVVILLSLFSHSGLK